MVTIVEFRTRLKQVAEANRSPKTPILWHPVHNRKLRPGDTIAVLSRVPYGEPRLAEYRGHCGETVSVRYPTRSHLRVIRPDGTVGLVLRWEEVPLSRIKNLHEYLRDT